MKYETVNGKSYRKCGYCDHYINGECNLFHAKCQKDNGCTEEVIRKKEQKEI